jgi:predicted dehydrogenase
LQAVAAGVPVMVEKPLLITNEQLKQLESTLINTSVPVHLGYRLRHNQSMLKLRERLRNVRRIRCIYELDIDKLAEGKEWTYQYLSTGGSFFTLGIHALDLARWLVRCRGERFSDLRATADSNSPATDYPLRVSLSGLLSNGIHIEAGADLRANLSSAVDLQVEAEEGTYPDGVLPPPRLEDEPDEYRALIGDFIKAVRTGAVDAKELEEVLQCHRELLAAREQSGVSS